MNSLSSCQVDETKVSPARARAPRVACHSATASFVHQGPRIAKRNRIHLFCKSNILPRLSCEFGELKSGEYLSAFANNGYVLCPVCRRRDSERLPQMQRTKLYLWPKAAAGEPMEPLLRLSRETPRHVAPSALFHLFPP